MSKHGVSEAEIDSFIKERLEAQKEHAQKNRTASLKWPLNIDCQWPAMTTRP